MLSHSHLPSTTLMNCLFTTSTFPGSNLDLLLSESDLRLISIGKFQSQKQTPEPITTLMGTQGSFRG